MPCWPHVVACVVPGCNPASAPETAFASDRHNAMAAVGIAGDPSGDSEPGPELGLMLVLRVPECPVAYIGHAPGLVGAWRPMLHAQRAAPRVTRGGAVGWADGPKGTSPSARKTGCRTTRVRRGTTLRRACPM